MINTLLATDYKLHKPAEGLPDYHNDPFYHKALQHIQQGSWQQATFLLQALVNIYRDAIELHWLLDDVTSRQEENAAELEPALATLPDKAAQTRSNQPTLAQAAAPLSVITKHSPQRIAADIPAVTSAPTLSLGAKRGQRLNWQRSNSAPVPTKSAPAPLPINAPPVLYAAEVVNQRQRQPAITPALPRTAGGQGWRVNRFGQVSIAYLRTIKWSVVGAILAVLGETATELLAPWPIKYIFDVLLASQPLTGVMGQIDLLLGGDRRSLLLFLAIMIAVIAALNGLFTHWGTYLTSRIGFQFVSNLRRELFTHLQQLPISFHQTNKRGEVLTKISSDTQMVRELLAETGLNLLTSWLSLGGMLVVMVFVNWQLSIIPLIITPVLLYLVTHMRGKLSRVVQSQRKEEGKLVARLSENLANISVVKAFGRESHEVARFENENRQGTAEGIQSARLGSAISRMVSTVSAVGLATVVFFGAWQAMVGRLSPGDVLLFISYVKGVFKPIREIAKLSTKMTRAMVSAQRINDILETEGEKADDPNALAVDHLSGRIDFQHVTFRYPRNDDGIGKDGLPYTMPLALHDVSFSVQPGQRVALVGASGAGKSTIIHMLLRLFEPQLGNILLDGVDVRRYQREPMRGQIGLVLQDSILFGASIRENISYGKPDATLQEIEAAAQQANIHDFIASLPNGYETIVGENGSNLSGGQKQRIAIARALVKQPSILILDEPTSALDAESQAQVQETLARMEQRRTILVITHQLSLIQNFDLILVMDKGQIVERGAHEELMQQQGAYAQLYQLQQGA